MSGTQNAEHQTVPVPESFVMESHERLVRLEEKVDSLVEIAKEVRYAINGNGDPGLKTRVDRLEQSESRRNTITGWVGAAAVASVVGWVWNLVSGK